MASLNYDTGVIQWLASDGVSTTYTVNLAAGFDLKAIQLSWIGIASATNASSSTVSERRGRGFATGTASRRAAASFSADGSASSDCGGVVRDDAVAACCDGSAGSTGRLDVDSFSSTQFVLIVDEVVGSDLTVMWSAWGGSDITVAAVGTISEPASTGVQTHTVTGFTSGATDQVVIIAGVHAAATTNTPATGNSGFSVGWASDTTDAANFVVVGSSNDASATMNTDRYAVAGECLATLSNVGSSAVPSRAKLTQWNANNFGLNWIARNTTGRKSIFLAMKGGQWTAGNSTIDQTTLNATSTISGLSYAPSGLLAAAHWEALQTPGTSTTYDLLSYGAGASTSSRRSFALRDEDGAADAEIGTAIRYDALLVGVDNAGVVNRRIDIDAMTSDGFRLIVDEAFGFGGGAFGYLTFGPATSSSVALSGNAGTGAVGSLGKAVSLAISGNAGTGAVGSFGLAVSTALSGEVGTGAIGSLGLAISVALSGNSATGSVGTLALSSPALAGNAATGSVGSLGLAVGTSLAGEAATGAVGSVGVAAAVTLSGNVGTGAVGSLGLAAAISITGNAGTGAVGSLGLTGGVALTGNAGTGSVGSVGLAVAVALTGNAGTGSAGSLSLTGGNLSVTWTGEDDWRSARAESGVIYRNFGDRVSTEIAMGTDLLPQGPVDWFGVGQEQCTNPLLGTHSVYDSTANKTFITWSGIRLRPFITYYDHTLGAWGPVVQISTVTLTNDSHGMPQMCQDASGYLHVFWGTHNNDAEYAISTTARDISAWTVQTDVTGYWSYQQPFVISGNIWLFGREEPSLGTTYNLSVKSSVGVATGHSWNSLTALVSFSGKMVYPSDYLVVGPDVHIVWNTRQNPSGTVNNIYYAVYETDTGLLKNVSGTDMGTLPISEATANSNCRVFNSGTDESNAGALWLDSSSNPHIAFIHDNTTTVDMRHTRWTGSAWTTPAVIATENGLWGKPAVINPTDTTVDLYYRRPSDGAVRKATFDPSDDTGITLSTFLSVGDWTPNGTLTYIGPTIIRDAHADLQMLLSEYLASNYWREDLRIGAWGDSGWVQAPAWRQDGGLALPLNEDSGASTLVDASGHGQDATNSGIVMGSTGLLGLTGATLASASSRYATVPHNGSQWIWNGQPGVVRFWGNDLADGIMGKGRAGDNTLRFGIYLSTTLTMRVMMRRTTTSYFAISSSVASWSGFHLYEFSWDGAGTMSFFRDGAALGTSTGIADMATSPTVALDIGRWQNDAGNIANFSYGNGILQGLVMIPRYQTVLADHQAFWNTLTAGSFTSKWVEAA